MQQAEILPQQSLQTIVSWGTAFLARPTEERELVQVYGKPLYQGAIAFSKWWRALSIGQIQAVNQINFPYWTLPLASRLAKVPLNTLNSCLEALQKGQLSVGKLSRIISKFIAPQKLSFGRTITSEDWDLIARSFDLDGERIDEIRQLALRTNGASAKSVTTDDVIEILRERGYPIAQILPKPRIKRYSRTEVEREVQEALQALELESQAARERIRQLELENVALRNHTQSSEASLTTVEVTAITPSAPNAEPLIVEKTLVQSERTSSDEGDVFDLTLWEPFESGENVQTVDITPVESSGAELAPNSESEQIIKDLPLKIQERVRLVDKGEYRDYYGCTGIIKGRSTNAWWVRLDNGDYKQFPASALERLRESPKSSEAFVSIPSQLGQKLSEVGRTLFGSNLHPMAG
ncbi:hypothetical protein HC931_07675 [Candidatus Gracilibacteria bacterium]|nr:hypothetical protein [Candidatus Gracilibacteria bacterium]NJM89156.1 hypothetical protein [Hydrococcus sp. RU_2_2]NJP20979.1 hypothetical protein [Hydrococcus sp. CRU_1_1]